jgi:hypothetical protein
MKSLLLGLVAASLMFVGVSFAAQKASSYNGDIMDSACAATGSHSAMMKSDPSMKTAKDCTVGCVAHGAKYVLYNAGRKITYQLDDQKKPVQFAGSKVMVTGTLDEATNTIHVTAITLEPPQGGD